MFNLTKLINTYCGNETNTLIYNDDLNSFGACFQFTLIENPCCFILILVLAYMIGNLRPDELNSIQSRKKKEFIFLFIELLAIVIYSICVLIDNRNYYLIYKLDYNGYVNLAFKLTTAIYLAYFTYKSFRLFNYSSCRLFALNLLLTLLIITEIFHYAFIKKNFKIFLFLDAKLIYCYIKLIAIFSYFSLFNFAHFVTKRHSLFYESFANYDSSFNLDTIVDINQYRKSYISKLFFNWVQPFLIRAANDQIRNEADIFNLPDALTSSFVKKQVQITFNELRSETNQQGLEQVETQDESVDRTNRQSFSFNNQIIDINQAITQIKLWKLLWKIYKNELFRISYLKLIADVFSFVSPIVLNLLITYIDSKDFTSYGFILVLILFVSSTISSLSINLHDFLINNLWIKVKSTCVNLTYRKLFSLRTSSLHDNFSNGQLLNYASVDSDRVANFCTSSFQLISMPLQIIVVLYLLYLQIHFSFIAALLFSIALIILNKFISFKIAETSQRLLGFKDQRIRLSSKLITGIKTIKMNCWQDIYTKKINETRKQELKMLRKKKLLDAICVYMWAVSSTLISFLTFCTHVLLGNKLDAATVFTTLALLNMIINPLNSFFFVITGVLESWVSVKRIQEFFDMNIEEDMLKDQQQQQQKASDKENENVIEFEDLVVEHKVSDLHGFKFVLGPIDMVIKRGELIGVVGNGVGSGKSTFLNAILNELPSKSDGVFFKTGQIKLNCGENGIAYVCEQPFIQNDTIRNNILFGKQYEYKFYNSVLDACELRKDLEMFKDYDNTIVSDKGISLSGGQKSRLGLARALYQSKDLDLFLIDDPFSSLDPIISSKVFEQTILNFLSNKTRIVCINQLDFMSKVDRIVLLENGCVKKIGTPDEILKEINKSQIVSKLSKDVNVKPLKDVYNLDQQDNEFKEEISKGKVKLAVYSTYIKAVGIPMAICVISFVFMMQTSKLSTDYWLSYWVNRLKINPDEDTVYYLKVFLIIVIVNSLLAGFRSFLFAIMCINGAKNLYKRLYNVIVCSKISFFNVRTFGQIINRLNSDVYHVDENLPFTLNLFLASLFSVFSVIAVTIYSVPFSLLILLILCVPYYKTQHYYRYGSMILKRFNSNLLSPIFSQFHETLIGLTTIRSFNSSKRFIKHFEEKVDMANSANYSLKAITQWLNLRIQLIGICLSCFIASVGCICHYYGFTQQTSLVALGLVYSLSITTVLNGLISSFTTLEIDFVSVERMIHYFENEEKERPGMIRLTNDFPKNGEIEFENVSFKYKSDSNYALNSVSFKIKSGEFIGILGRTAAGKSTIFSTLFRMYDLLNGSIYIDNQNIKLLHLETLRRGMFIISQDPFLFDGTIRDNLDPRNNLNDDKLWDAIEQCDAKAIILKLGGLNATINDQETNLSVGEKQLICIIRALLCNVKILCLDESSSSLDQLMEAKICKTIKNVFSRSTILMISHRPSSVLDCDKVMVLENGKLVEYDKPSKLICDSKSIFHKMWLVQQNKS